MKQKCFAYIFIENALKFQYFSVGTRRKAVHKSGANWPRSR
jgi:hypothetical protein